jgi:hypothetical protein
MKQININPIENMLNFYIKKIKILEDNPNNKNCTNSINAFKNNLEVISSLLKVSYHSHDRIKNYFSHDNIQNFRTYDNIVKVIHKNAYDSIIFGHNEISSTDMFIQYFTEDLNVHNKSIRKNYNKEIENIKTNLFPFYENINRTIELTDRLIEVNEYLINRPFYSETDKEDRNKSFIEITGIKVFEEAMKKEIKF